MYRLHYIAMISITILLLRQVSVEARTPVAQKLLHAGAWERLSHTPGDSLIRVGFIGNTDSIAHALEQAGGQIITRTLHTITAVTTAHTALTVAALDAVININQGYASTAPESPHSAYTPLPLHVGEPQNRDYVVKNSGLEQIRDMQPPLVHICDGKGILIGTIEDGLVDFRHPDFLTKEGKTRFVAIWNQLQTGTDAPAPFGYGRLLTPEILNKEIAGQTKNFPAFGYKSEYSTEVMGVAAGNGFATGKYCGVAPEASLISVAWNYDEVQLIDAVRYIFQVADSLDMPCVITRSSTLYESYYNVPDGSSIASIALSDMVAEKPGRAIVASAGNNGHLRRHIPESNTGQRFYWLHCNEAKPLYLNLKTYNHIAKMMMKDVDHLQMAFHYDADTTETGLLDTNLTYQWHPLSALMATSDTTFYLTQSPRDTLYEFRIEPKVLTDSTVGLSITVTDRYAGTPDALKRLIRIGISGTGSYEAWTEYFFPLVDSAYWGDDGTTPRLSFPQQYLFCNNERSVYPPSDGRNIIAVGGFWNQTEFITSSGKKYIQKGYMGEDTVYPGQMYSTTQPGGLVNGNWKPTVMTSSLGIAAPIPLDLVDYQGLIRLEGGHHEVFSSASPSVLSGAVALYLQDHPTATAETIINALSNAAYADKETGPTPNPRCGYGKLNIFALVTGGLASGVENERKNAPTDEGIQIYPNPATGTFTIQYTAQQRGMATISIMDILGKELYHEGCRVESGIFTREIRMPSEAHGMYILQIRQHRSSQTRLILLQ